MKEIQDILDKASEYAETNECDGCIIVMVSPTLRGSSYTRLSKENLKMAIEQLAVLQVSLQRKQMMMEVHGDE